MKKEEKKKKTLSGVIVNCLMQFTTKPVFGKKRHMRKDQHKGKTAKLKQNPYRGKTASET